MKLFKLSIVAITLSSVVGCATITGSIGAGVGGGSTGIRAGLDIDVGEIARKIENNVTRKHNN